MGRPAAQQQRRGRRGGHPSGAQRHQQQKRAAKLQRQGLANPWIPAEEPRHPTKRGGKARRSKAQQQGQLSHGAIAKAKRQGDLARRFQTLIADQFPTSWAAPPSQRQLLHAYNAAYGTLQPQPYGFKSAHQLVDVLLKELLPQDDGPAAKRSPKKCHSEPLRAPECSDGPAVLRHGRPAQQALLWRAPTVACSVHPHPTPSSQLHAQMLRFAELMLPDQPTLRRRREAVLRARVRVRLRVRVRVRVSLNLTLTPNANPNQVLRVTALAQETFPGCRVELFGSNATGLALHSSDFDLVLRQKVRVRARVIARVS